MPGGHKTDKGDKNEEEQASHLLAGGFGFGEIQRSAASSVLQPFITGDHTGHRWAPRVMITARGRSWRKTKKGCRRS